MKNRERLVLVCIVLSGLMLSCLLPGMIPLKSEPQGPMPYMEENADKVIEVLTGKDWRYLHALAKENYTQDDFAKPGTLSYTIDITDDLPTYFVYGWCAVDDETLQQNFEHIDVQLYFNDEKLGTDVVQNLTYTSPDELRCLDFGVLMSEWPEGEYTLEAVATFDEKINDGLADYEPGDYIFIYNVTVKKAREGVFAPSFD